ncbi:MAG: rod shape-determining protein RodA [Actinobacteria bacterium]|nr:MAG: rod shape-determining protein RodA [Actinomycetota bacterium]TMK46149.1 MAG: rod shape-determining protein RodA [Actinomycetota bacterium]
MDVVATKPYVSERRPLRHLDPILLLSVLALGIVGLVTIYSATHASLVAQRIDPGFYLKKQLTFVTLGVVVILVAASFDYRFVKVYAGIIYVASLALLVLVRTPLGTTVRGSQRWFQLFGFQLAPSELAKLALVAMLAAFLSQLRSSDLSLQALYRATAIAAVPGLLVFLQPDLGTSIVLVAILVGILVVAGARARHLGVLALTAIVLIFGALQLGLVKDYQIARLTAFFDPQNDPQRSDYNRTQAEIAIGSGGLLGRGYLKGTQTNLDFVPEQHTDFIFTVIGEEFGFVGAIFVLMLFALLIWRAVRIALLAKDPFGTYLAAGIASMLAIQVFVNVGMTLGIMPITGIPLPFVSYGGSSFLTNCAAVGLLLNVHMRRLV